MRSGTSALRLDVQDLRRGLGVLGPYDQLDAVHEREMRPQAARVIAANRRRDPRGIERAPGHLRLGPRSERAHDDELGVAHVYTPMTSTSSLTAPADFLNAASSSGVSLIWMISSRPRAPSLQGTPTNRFCVPYSPCRYTEHGRIFFLSSRMASTISTTD